MYEIKGSHYAVDIFDGEFDKLNDGEYLFSLLKEAAESCGATVMKDENGKDIGEVVKFVPQGVTAFLVLTESHISCHSYPEQGFIAVDCYTCGSPDPKIAVAHVLDALQSNDYEIRFMPRGR